MPGETRPDYKFTIEPNFGHDFDQEWNEESWCPENEVSYKHGYIRIWVVINMGGWWVVGTEWVPAEDSSSLS